GVFGWLREVGFMVGALPMAAIFIASMANNDLPRDVVAATAMTGSLLSGLGREAPGATSSPARPLGLEVPMRRQDGRSVSKLTNHYQRLRPDGARVAIVIAGACIR